MATTTETTPASGNGHAPERTQLTFEVGGSDPSLASVKTTVDLRVDQELRKGSQVRVAVTTVHGEVLAERIGKVVAVTFEDHYNKDGFLVATERVHKVKLG